MANTFKSYAGTFPSSLTTLYTTPAGTVAVVSMLRATNIDGSSDATVDAQVTDTSATDTGYIGKDIVVPDGAPVNLIGGGDKVYLEAGDLIKINCSGSASCDYQLSLLEMT